MWYQGVQGDKSGLCNRGYKGVRSLSCQLHHGNFGRGRVIDPSSSQRLHLVWVGVVLRSEFFLSVQACFTYN